MFFPWVGSRFGDKDNFLKGERLLIVGESHYPGEENQYLAGKTYPEQTQETIQELAIDHPYRFFKVLSRLATGTPNEAWSAKQTALFGTLSRFTTSCRCSSSGRLIVADLRRQSGN